MRDRRSSVVAPRSCGRLPVALLAMLLAAGCTIAGCTVGGSAAIAPYRSPPLASLAARPVIASVVGALALSPSGSTLAVADAVHGVCLQPVPKGPSGVCADLHLSGKGSTSAQFSPDGQSIALGRDVSAQAGGQVWLVDAHLGTAREVPQVEATAAVGTSGAPGSAVVAAAGRAGYVSMLWNRVDGHLLLLSNSRSSDGYRTRLVDVDPVSLIPRVVALATGPYEFQSGYFAAGGTSVIFTVVRGDQIAPDLVVIDLGTGVRREFGPLGPSGTHLVPLAVSPDGRQAIVGSATYGDSGPPRRLDLLTGKLTEIDGLYGNFVMAGYSPNGSQIAVASTAGASAMLLQVASAQGGPARTVGEFRGSPTTRSLLTWSGVDALAISSPAPRNIGTLLGWVLTG